MSGGIEEAARYEEQCMKKSLETGKATGRLEELKPEAPGGYAPLVPRRFENELPEQVIDTALRETGLDKSVLEPHPLQKVFDEVINQVSKGKGEERHGNGKAFLEQPWYSLAETHGIGFLTGQARKKLDEAQGMTDDRWRREMIGSVAYAMMALLYDDIKKDGK